MPLSTVLLIAANLLPLVGVVFWGWDAFVILILYWLETAVIGFWTIVRTVVMTQADRTLLNFRSTRPNAGMIGRGGTALFLTVHAGIFMTVHFLFLWTLFSGHWSDRIHTPADFINQLIVGTGLWLPLLFLFLVRGWLVFRPVLLALFGLEPEDSAPSVSNSIVLGLYIRIFVMQIAIIFGGWVTMLLGGNIGTLVLLVVGKTVAEFWFEPLTRRVETASAKAAAERDGA